MRWGARLSIACPVGAHSSTLVHTIPIHFFQVELAVLLRMLASEPGQTIPRILGSNRRNRLTCTDVERLDLCCRFIPQTDRSMPNSDGSFQKGTDSERQPRRWWSARGIDARQPKFISGCPARFYPLRNEAPIIPSLPRLTRSRFHPERRRFAPRAFPPPRHGRCSGAESRNRREARVGWGDPARKIAL